VDVTNGISRSSEEAILYMDTFDAALLILRLGVGLTFAAHGAQKIFGWWGGPGISAWKGAIEHMGFRPVTLFTAISALAEFGGGLFLAAGLLTPIAGAVLVGQSVVIIGHVHWPKGFFNTKGGYEFPLVLAVGAVALTLIEAGAWSVDAAIGFSIEANLRVALVVLGIIGGLVSLAVPRLSAQNPAAQS
jgi:putative oxidoreductase